MDEENQELYYGGEFQSQNNLGRFRLSGAEGGEVRSTLTHNPNHAKPQAQN